MSEEELCHFDRAGLLVRTAHPITGARLAEYAYDQGLLRDFVVRTGWGEQRIGVHRGPEGVDLQAASALVRLVSSSAQPQLRMVVIGEEVAAEFDYGDDCLTRIVNGHGTQTRVYYDDDGGIERIERPYRTRHYASAPGSPSTVRRMSAAGREKSWHYGEDEVVVRCCGTTPVRLRRKGFESRVEVDGKALYTSTDSLRSTPDGTLLVRRLIAQPPLVVRWLDYSRFLRLHRHLEHGVAHAVWTVRDHYGETAWRWDDINRTMAFFRGDILLWARRYDPSGLLAMLRTRQGATVQVTRGPAEVTVSEATESETRRTRYHVSEDGNLTGVTSTSGLYLGWTHDRAGRMIAMRTASGASARIRYQKYVPSEIQLPGGGVHRFEWLGDHVEAWHCRQSHSPEVTLMQLSRNQDGQVVQRSRAGLPSEHYEYDDVGRLSAAVAGPWRLDLEYSPDDGAMVRAAIQDDRPITIAQHAGDSETIDVAGAHVVIQRDCDDTRLTEELRVNGEPLGPTIYEAGMTRSAGPLHIRPYGPSRVRESLVNKVAIVTTRNGFGEIVGRTLELTETAKASVLDLELTWSAGNLTALRLADGADISEKQFEYDADGQLIEVVLNGTATERFSYGDNLCLLRCETSHGHEESETDELGRLQTYAGSAVEADDAGRIRLYVEEAATHRFEYDPLGRVNAYHGPAGGWRLRYDHVSRPTCLTDQSGRSVIFVHDRSDRLVATVDTDGRLLASYYYADESRVPDVIVARGEVPIAILKDHLESPIACVDSNSGKIVARYEYSAFGRRRLHGRDAAWPFAFAGGLQFSDGAPVLFRHRFLEPRLARWLTPDPIGFAGDPLNLYRYCMNNPAMVVDPSGTETIYISCGVAVWGTSFENRYGFQVGIAVGPHDQGGLYYETCEGGGVGFGPSIGCQFGFDRRDPHETLGSGEQATLDTPVVDAEVPIDPGSDWLNGFSVGAGCGFGGGIATEKCTRVPIDEWDRPVDPPRPASESPVPEPPEPEAPMSYPPDEVPDFRDWDDDRYEEEQRRTDEDERWHDEERRLQDEYNRQQQWLDEQRRRDEERRLQDEYNRQQQWLDEQRQRDEEDLRRETESPGQ